MFDIRTNKARLPKYFAGALVPSLAIATYLLAARKFGDAVLWCWIPSQYNYHQFFCFYIFVFGAVALNLYVLVEVTSRPRPGTASSSDIARGVRSRVLSVVFVSSSSV